MLHLRTAVYQKVNLVAPFHAKKTLDGLPQGFLLSTTFYNSHTPPSSKQKESTLAFCSPTFPSFPYLHASNLLECRVRNWFYQLIGTTGYWQ